VRWWAAVLDLLFPPRCVSCHRLGDWLCAECRNAIEMIPVPMCRFCALPLPEHETSGVCPSCRDREHILDGLISCAFHDGPLRRAIHDFKYGGLYSLAHSLGQIMADRWLRLRPLDKVEAIVPVPLHRRREHQRGYNQAALLARELGRRLQAPVVEDRLIRTRATARQTELNAAQRRINVQGAFACREGAFAGRSVLLVDDVCTTGSTLEAACTALKKEGGAADVWAFTLTRARPASVP